MNWEQEQKTDVLLKVSKLIGNGHMQKFKDLVKKIESEDQENKLPDGLKKLYDEVGSTPLDEPEVYELSQQIVKGEMSIIDLVLRYLKDEELDEYSIDDVVMFANMIMKKVASKKDDNGIYKQTESTKQWQRPKPSHLKKYEAIIKKMQKATTDSEKQEINDDFENFILESSCLKDVNLTEWEKQLVIDQTVESLRGSLNSALGKI